MERRRSASNAMPKRAARHDDKANPTQKNTKASTASSSGTPITASNTNSRTSGQIFTGTNQACSPGAIDAQLRIAPPLASLGEDAVRRQLANHKLLMNGRVGLAQTWLAEKAMAREDAWVRLRLIIRIMVVACAVVAGVAALPMIKSWIG